MGELSKQCNANLMQNAKYISFFFFWFWDEIWPRHLFSVFTSLITNKGFLFDSCTAYLVALYWMILPVVMMMMMMMWMNHRTHKRRAPSIYTCMFKALVLLSLQYALLNAWDLHHFIIFESAVEIVSQNMWIHLSLNTRHDQYAGNRS